MAKAAHDLMMVVVDVMVVDVRVVWMVEMRTMGEMKVMILVIPSPFRETLLALSHSYQSQGLGLHWQCLFSRKGQCY